MVAGAVVLLLGLNFIGLFKIGFLNKTGRRNMNTKNMTFFSALLFGIAFSVGWTPCVGAFLGSALMMASSEGSTLAGVWMLLLYSLGLGLPFVLSALLIDRLKGAFDWIKRHYRAINLISGGLLILVGVLMATGLWAVCSRCFPFSPVRARYFSPRFVGRQGGLPAGEGRNCWQ